MMVAAGPHFLSASGRCDAKPNCSSLRTCHFLRCISVRPLPLGLRNTTRSYFRPPLRVISAMTLPWLGGRLGWAPDGARCPDDDQDETNVSVVWAARWARLTRTWQRPIA